MIMDFNDKNQLVFSTPCFRKLLWGVDSDVGNYQYI